MARRPSIALLTLVALAFFLFGLYSVTIGAAPNPSAGAGTPARAGTSQQFSEPGASNTTLLILGVSDLSDPEAELEAIWYISFGYPSQDIFLLGVSPAAVPPGAQAGLESVFAWRPGEGVSAAFLEQLADMVPLEIEGSIVLDRPGFARVIDFLGGVVLNSSTFQGEQVLGILSLTEDDPQATLQMQRRLLEAMTARANLLGRTPEITELVELIPDHLHSSISVNRAVMLVAPLLPIRAERTHIETY